MLTALGFVGRWIFEEISKRKEAADQKEALVSEKTVLTGDVVWSFVQERITREEEENKLLIGTLRDEIQALRDREDQLEESLAEYKQKLHTAEGRLEIMVVRIERYESIEAHLRAMIRELGGDPSTMPPLDLTT
ncbi:MAG: hypothetical protein AAFQ53_13220 [Bacteroidota bacterium]